MSRRFGTTWWGGAWIQALERSDPSGGSALRRGRTAARRGAVRSLELREGHLAARVVGSHGELHDLTIAVRPLADSEWRQVAEAIASRASHLAALLDGELHPDVVADASEVDVELLPRTADLRPDCDCEEYASPCTHAAAASYLVADELDRDPFALLLLRGRKRTAVLDLVRAARGADATDGATTDPAAERTARGLAGTGPAAAAHDETGGADDDTPAGDLTGGELWRGRHLDDVLGAPPEPARSLNVPPRPGVVTPWDADPPPRHGIDPRRVDDLAHDAVERAWTTLVDGAPTGLRSGARADLARRAAGHPELVTELASLGGVTPARLRVWADAWARFGDIGVTLVTEPSSWCQDPEVLETGRQQLVALGMERRAIAVNYDSLRCAPEIWLVVGPDGGWYRLGGTDKHQDVRMVAGPATDPSDLMDLPPGATLRPS